MKIGEKFSDASVTLEQRLAHAAGTYQTIQDYMGWNNDTPDEEVIQSAQSLSPSERYTLAALYRNQIDALQKLKLPQSYLDIIDDIHKQTVTSVLETYGASKIEIFSFAEKIKFMQFIADVQADQWRKKFPDIFSDYPSTTVIPKFHDGDNAFSLTGNVQNGYQYNVPERQAGNIVHLADIAAHEPQHSVQRFLCEKMEAGEKLPHPLKEAAILFGFLRNHEINNYSPGLFFKEEPDMLDYKVYDAYLSIPTEVAAFHQGTPMRSSMPVIFPQLVNKASELNI